MKRRGRPADKKLYVNAVMAALPSLGEIEGVKEEELSILRGSLTKLTCVELTILAKSLSTESECRLPNKTDAQKNRLKILETT